METTTSPTGGALDKLRLSLRTNDLRTAGLVLTRDLLGEADDVDDEVVRVLTEFARERRYAHEFWEDVKRFACRVVRTQTSPELATSCAVLLATLRTPKPPHSNANARVSPPGIPDVDVETVAREEIERKLRTNRLFARWSQTARRLDIASDAVARNLIPSACGYLRLTQGLGGLNVSSSLEECIRREIDAAEIHDEEVKRFVLLLPPPSTLTANEDDAILRLIVFAARKTALEFLANQTNDSFDFTSFRLPLLSVGDSPSAFLARVFRHTNNRLLRAKLLRHLVHINELSPESLASARRLASIEASYGCGIYAVALRRRWTNWKSGKARTPFQGSPHLSRRLLSRLHQSTEFDSSVMQYHTAPSAASSSSLPSSSASPLKPLHHHRRNDLQCSACVNARDPPGLNDDFGDAGVPAMYFSASIDMLERFSENTLRRIEAEARTGVRGSVRVCVRRNDWIGLTREGTVMDMAEDEMPPAMREAWLDCRLSRSRGLEGFEALRRSCRSRCLVSDYSSNVAVEGLITLMQSISKLDLLFDLLSRLPIPRYPRSDLEEATRFLPITRLLMRCDDDETNEEHEAFDVEALVNAASFDDKLLMTCVYFARVESPARCEAMRAAIWKHVRSPNPALFYLLYLKMKNINPAAAKKALDSTLEAWIAPRDSSSVKTPTATKMAAFLKRHKDEISPSLCLLASVQIVREWKSMLEVSTSSDAKVDPEIIPRLLLALESLVEDLVKRAMGMSAAVMRQVSDAKTTLLSLERRCDESSRLVLKRLRLRLSECEIVLLWRKFGRGKGDVEAMNRFAECALRGAGEERATWSTRSVVEMLLCASV